ncbi:MAG: hypothetical protein LIP23_04665 [Planctomycetes bacterium]|nr:hypothetical protein [Planctomycetota bacterium]
MPPLSRSLAIVLCCICLAASARAGETVMVPLLSGIYKLDVPVGWYVQEEPDGTAVAISPEKDHPAQVVVYAPNILVDDFENFARQFAETVWLTSGGEGQPDIKEELLSGFPARSVYIAGQGFKMQAHVVNLDVAVVTMMAAAPDALADEFFPAAAAIFESHDIFLKQFRQNAELLQQVANAMNEEEVVEQE